MKVFEACLLIIKRHYLTFLIYFTIFIGLSVIISTLTADNFTPDFSAMKPNFTVVNRDADSPLTGGLISYLRENGNEIAIRDDKGALQDATFFHATDYIIIIPQGFRESFLSGEPLTPETVKTTDTALGYYADSLVNQYLNQARLYLAAGAGFSEEALVTAVLSDLSLQAVAVKKHFGTIAPIDRNFLMYSQMQCYILLVLVILCVTNITMVFKRTDLRMRNLCSPIKPLSMSSRQILCSAILGVLAWLLTTVTGLILYSSKLEAVDNRVLALIMLNSLIFTVVALALAALSGTFVRNPNAQNAVTNILALGMCFLGGVFVPASMLGEGVLTVARFLPTYWCMEALEQISALTSFEAGALQPVWQAMLIQLSFAGAFFCVTLVLSKYLNRSERSFGSTRSELEA